MGWDAIPRQTSSRSFTHQPPYVSPGRTHRAACDFAWFDLWSGSLCSAAEAHLGFGNQVPLPATESVMRCDLRTSNIFIKPSPPSSPHPRVYPAATPVAPATSIVQPVSLAAPSIHLSSQPVHSPPYLSARVRAPASSLDVKSPEQEATESLSVRAIPESGGEPTPPLLSPKRDLQPASREATSHLPKNSKTLCPTLQGYF